jgi:5-(carboxyamino)imidazole ribonucleotide mutase
MAAKVAIVMGSDSDYDQMKGAWTTLADFGVEHKVRVLSAHRTPEALHEFMSDFISNGGQVIIAGAGGAAHLAGVCSSISTLPVIGVPIKTSLSGGMDSLLATVQMPPGMPVATVATGGSKNAALLAVQILALSDADLDGKVKADRAAMKEKVAAKDAKVQERIAAGE